MRIPANGKRTMPDRPSASRWRPAFAALVRALAVSLALSTWPATSAAQAVSGDAAINAGEEPVKAAFLYKFPNYVEWPASSFPKIDSPYVIGVIGNDAIASDLSRMSANRSIRNRPIIVKDLASGESLHGIHLLFIGRSERTKLPQLLKQLASQPTLTVTETDDALTQGSMINFRIVEERVRFEISLDAAEKSGLKLSSRLLALATSVIKGAQK